MQNNWFSLSKGTVAKISCEQFMTSMQHNMSKYGNWVPCMDTTRYNLITGYISTYHPVIAFHGTSGQDTINSIIKYGYGLPGDVLLSTGETVEMRVGKLYGPGVYTTTNLNTAKSYSYYDHNNTMRLIVNIVLPGNVENIYPFSVRYHYNQNNQANFVTCTYKDSNDSIKYDSTYISGPGILVVRNPTNVIPVGTILIKDHQNTIHPLSNRLNYLDEIQDVEEIEFKRIFNCDGHDHWTLKFIPDTTQETKNNTKTKTQTNHLLIPSHLLRNQIIKEGIQNYINTLQNCCVTVFDDSKHYQVQGKIPDLQNFVSGFRFSVHSDDLSKSIDGWLEKILKSGSESEFCFVVAFFDHRYKGNPIREYMNSFSQHSINITIRGVYIDVDYKSSIIHDTYCLQTLDNTVSTQYNEVNYLLQATVSESARSYDEMGSQDTLKYASTSKLPFNQIMNALREQQNNQAISCEDKRPFTMHCCVPYPYGESGSGFISSLDAFPAWDTYGTYPMIWKGKPPKYLRINGSYYKIWINELVAKKKQGMGKNLRKFAPKIKEHERIPMTHQQMVKGFMQGIRPIIGMFRNKIIIDPHLYQEYRLLFNNFLDKCTELLDQYVLSPDNPDITGVKDLYHYITNLHTEMNLYGNLKGDALKGKFFSRMKGLHFCTKIFKRAQNNREITIQGMADADLTGRKIDSVDALFGNSACGLLEGYGAKITNSNASEIDPWLLIVNDVIPTKFHIRDIYLLKELGITIGSDTKYQINGIVIPRQSVNQNNKELVRGFNAYQYTGSPFLSIPNQGLALLTNSCCGILEHLLLDVKMCRKQKLQIDPNRFRKQLELLETLNQGIEYGEKYDQLWDQLMVDPITVLMDLQKIPSLTMIMGILLSENKKRTIPTELKKHIYRLIFMESLRRTVCGYMKLSKLKVHDVIELILKPSKVLGRNTNTFFQNRLIAATPFCIVACLGYLDRKEQGMSLDLIANDFIQYSISVMEFFKLYFPDMIANCLTPDVGKLQIALVLRCLNGLSNTMFDLNDNMVIEIETNKLKEHKQNLEKILSIQNAKSDYQKDKIINKIKNFITENHYYVTAHNKLPRIFSKEEVDVINSTRKKNSVYHNDMLELMNNGLLKHHCCFQECPDYLGKSLATVKDITNGTRHGLFRHMKINIVQGNYYRSLHKKALYLLKQGYVYDYEKFKKAIFEHIKCYYETKISKNLQSLPVTEEQVLGDAEYVSKQLWESYAKNM